MNRLIHRSAIILSLLMLIFAIGFNLWLYRAEPTALVDPNDNAFQYALVERTNEIWNWAEKECNGQKTINNKQHISSPFTAFCLLSYLVDHWVPNWAEGYNLPYYYSHVPQIVIVGTYRSIQNFPIKQLRITDNGLQNNQSAMRPPAGEAGNSQSSNLSLFTYYHWIIYFLLCFFPLSVFLSLRLIRLPWLTAGIGAILATQISTDGLYGLDPSSFLWRGWGLSSQLFAMIWMPLAIAYLIRITNYELRITNFNPLSLPRRQAGAIRNPLLINYFFAILFITLTTMGHLGMGMMLFLAIPVITGTKPVLTLLNHQSAGWRMSLEEIKTAFIQTALLALPPLILLSYWILPTVINGQYHNISFWDPIWKFNSYGAGEVLTNLVNGNLFDFGRLPIYTLLVLVGFFVCLLDNMWRVASISSGKSLSAGSIKNFIRLHFLFRKKSMEKKELGTEDRKNFLCDLSALNLNLASLSFLFLFFLLLYFGSTTWGAILTLIPGMNEFHQHRFIVGVHLMGLFLAPIGFMFIIDTLANYGLRITDFNPQSAMRNWQSVNATWKFQVFYLCLFISLSLGLFFSLSPQTTSYGTYNEELIQKANALYLTQKPDADLLLETLHTLPPGRVYAGRGGGWGKTFKVAETPYYMYLSTYGIPTVLWLPQTWSLNADTEQYFSEEDQNHYNLYNIQYVVAPPDQPPKKFWTLLKETKNWKLYGVDIKQEQNKNNSQFTMRNPQSDKYIAVGTSPAVIFSDKLSLSNLIRLWIQSDYPKKKLFPELRLRIKNQELRTTLPHFSMRDEASYKTPEGNIHSLFAEPPVYMNPWEWPTPMNNDIPHSSFLIDNDISIASQSSDHDMVFRATVKISPLPAEASSTGGCPTCIVLLKQTYHPNWTALVNGKKTETIHVFPSFVAVRLEEPGEYEIVFSYTPSVMKQILFFGSAISLIILGGVFLYRRFLPTLPSVGRKKRN